MNRKMMCLVFLVVTGLCSTPMLAQDKAVRDQLILARGQYYTPTASGLKSFHCDAAFDWKTMLMRFSRSEIPDDNPILKYLQTVHLSVTDELKGQGTLEWSNSAAPPQGKEDGIKQMRDGLQMMMSGFFQAWNAYMNGGMVPLPDKTVEVTASETGIHMHGIAASMIIDEDFDKNMLLTQAVVTMPTMKVVALPTYIRTDDGLVISAVASQVNQPPSAAPVEVDFRVEYARVESFQIPSHVVYDIKNVGAFEFSFNTCQVSVTDSTQKPTAEKSNNPTN